MKKLFLIANNERIFYDECLRRFHQSGNPRRLYRTNRITDAGYGARGGTRYEGSIRKRHFVRGVKWWNRYAETAPA